MSTEMKKDRMLGKKTAYFIFISIGFWFVFFCRTLRDLAEQGNVLWTGAYLFKTACLSLLFGGLFGVLFCFLLYRQEKSSGRYSGKNADKKQKNSKIQKQTESLTLAAAAAWKTPGPAFLACILLILLCWLPFYLAYYPGICAYDVPIQTGQIVSGSYNDHHPIAHTLLIRGAMELGEGLFGSVNTGIGLYTLLQQLFLASAFAWGVVRLGIMGVKSWQRNLVLFYAMLFPFHMYLGVSMTKDTIFTGFFILLLVTFAELLQKKRNELRPDWRDGLLFAGAVGMILFRNNGKYAMLVLLAVLFLTVCFGKKNRKLWGRLFLGTLGGFLAGCLLLSGLFKATGAEQGDRREMLSMPIQQLSRCMLYHGGAGLLPEDDNTMSENEKALIRDFILDEGYLEYRPDISDPVKSHTNTYVVRYRAGEFASTYLKLFGRYPGEFINAALSVNAGYLSPFDTSHAMINKQTGEKGLGYVQTRFLEGELKERGIYKDSKWTWLYERLEEWADSNAYLRIPLLKYLFVPGTWFWLCILLTGYLTVKRRFAWCIPMALLAGYYGTLFLGPTVQLRYIYPVMAALPFAAFPAMKQEESTF